MNPALTIVMRPVPRRLSYPLVGAAMSFGCPAGLLLVKWVAAGLPTLGPWAVIELGTDSLTYGYLAASTALVFVLLGALVGRRSDVLAAESSTDGLTGLVNRGSFDRRIGSEVLRAVRYGTPLSLLLLDVDGLKRFNDDFGHAAGDRALMAVARAVRSGSRRTDVAARYGGDEFAVLAPNTSSADAHALGQRIRRTLHQTVVTTEKGTFSPRVSVGVADLASSGGSVGELLAAADEALYDAKAAGRDRVSLARATASWARESASP